MRVRTPENLADEHSRKSDVGDVLGFAGNFVVTLHALNALTNDGKIFCFCHGRCFLALVWRSQPVNISLRPFGCLSATDSLW